jgi:hypothetical protein
MCSTGGRIVKKSQVLWENLFEKQKLYRTMKQTFLSFIPYSISLTNFSVLSPTLLNAPEFPNFPYIGRLYDIVIAVSSARHPEWFYCLSSFLSGK